MSNIPVTGRVLRLPNNQPAHNTREISLADFVYTDVDLEMDTCKVIKNRHGHTGTMSLSKARQWMTHTLWYDVHQENQNPCGEIPI